jgi:hypothetical protein
LFEAGSTSATCTVLLPSPAHRTFWGVTTTPLGPYYRRVAERYLSSQGELKPAKRPGEDAAANLQFA